MDNLHNHLLWLHCREHILAYSLGFHIVAELFGCLVAYVGVEQCASDFLKRLSNIDFGDFTFSLEDFKRPLKFV